MKTFDIIECADFLKVDRTTILKLAGAGEIPGAKIGRSWVFLEDDIVSFLRKKAQEQANTRLMGGNEEQHDDALQRAITRQSVAQDPRKRGRRSRTLPSLPDLPEPAAAP